MKNNVGILLPISSLPGKYGIGDFGSSADKFISWLKDNNFHYWQILPLNPLGSGNSPYLSICSLAIDIRYISLEKLYEEQYIKKLPPIIEDSERVDFNNSYRLKYYYLKKAYNNLTYKGDLESFKEKNPWAKEYAIYLTFKKINNDKTWSNWDKKYLDYPHTPFKLNAALEEEVNFIIFTQFIAYKQYRRVLNKAKKNNIEIIADMPFYVGYDSSDVYFNRDNFLLDEKYNPTLVAGVPPDYFSKEGQLWGSPIYDFSYMAKNNYRFLFNRLSRLAKNAHYLRIDHFRAFDTYYTIPYGHINAVNGEWKIGPRNDFFDKLYTKFPNINLIAEDLGDLFPSVYELRDAYNLPGMYVSQFHFFDEKFTTNDNLIVYTGTHDNDTFYSWFSSLKDYDYEYIKRRICYDGNKDLYEALIDYIISLPSKMCILPIQDLLKMDSAYRINTPGVVLDNNWSFKLKNFDILKNAIKLG